MAPKKLPPSAAPGSKVPPKPAAKQAAPKPQAAVPAAGFLPPGACNASRQRRNVFGNEFEPHFAVPNRLRNVPTPLVEAVNDFHFAMMNDTPRNEFYYELLKRNVTPESGVLEIGAGSGLLSMMAAKLGAKWVVAVEGSEDMAALARQNVKANGLEDRVRVYCMMSTELEVKHLPGQPDILVSEIFGTLLMGESAHDYIEDVRRRVLKPNGRVIPRYGKQFAVPIECPTLDSICSVKEWNGLNLMHVTGVKDTASTVFTKKYGFRMSSVPFKKLSEPICVVNFDFARDKRHHIKRTQNVTVMPTASGTAHAMLLFWEASDDGLVMSTDPDATRDNFPRDMQWGQALQLVDGGNEALPVDFVVEEGKPFEVASRASNDGVLLQFSLMHPGAKIDAKKPAAAAAQTESPAKKAAGHADPMAAGSGAEADAEAEGEDVEVDVPDGDSDMFADEEES